MFGLVAVIVIVVAVALIMSWRGNKIEIRQTGFYEISKIQNTDERAIKLEEFINEYPGTEVAFLADMWLGDFYRGKGDKEKAAAFFGDVVKETFGQPIYFVAVDAIVPIYIDLARYEDALTLLRGAIKLKSNPGPFEDELKLASVLELAGQLEEATQLYQKLAKDEKAPASVKLNAEERIVWLASRKTDTK